MTGKKCTLPKLSSRANNALSSAKSNVHSKTGVNYNNAPATIKARKAAQPKITKNKLRLVADAKRGAKNLSSMMRTGKEGMRKIASTIISKKLYAKPKKRGKK